MATLDELEAKYFPPITTVVPYREDTEVIPYIDGEEFFAAIAAAIDATTAGDLLYIVGWRYDNAIRLRESDPTTIADLLITKATAGVDVRLIVWTGRFFTGGAGLVEGERWWADLLHLKAIERFGGVSVVGNIAAIRQLRQMTAIPGQVPPPMQRRAVMDHGGGKTGSRHQKYVVVYRPAADDLRAFVSGLDIAPGRFAKYRHGDSGWHDAGVELHGEAAKSVWSDFKTRWDEALSLEPARFQFGDVREFFNPNAFAALLLPSIPDPTTATGTAVPTAGTSVRVLRSYAPWKDSPVWSADIPWDTLPSSGVQEILAVLTKAMRSATSYIYVEDQYLNTDSSKIEHDTLLGPLASASNRGVKVILVAPGDAGDFMSGEIQTFIENVGRMTNVVMYRVEHIFIHSKLVLIDDEFAAIGSANFADRSMEGRDTELTAALVHTGSSVRDLRVRLWAEHLDVDPMDPTVRGELGDYQNIGLSLFDPAWAAGRVTFPHDGSRLRRVQPLPPVPGP